MTASTHSNKAKQILIWRADLRNIQGQKVRSGKMAAQLAHASMAVLLNAGKYNKAVDEGEVYAEQFDLMLLPESTSTATHPDLPALREWLHGAFTKICVYVNSEQELLDVVAKAQQDGVYNALITDSGLTEFGGVPTNTCAAIGPAFSERIDPITGHLPLL
jgi:PTH2 family peptidyl-tRNA hydrolase